MTEQKPLRTDRKILQDQYTGGIAALVIQVALSLLLLTMTASAFASDLKEQEQKRILVLFSHHEGLPWERNVYEGLRAALASNSTEPIELMVEHADRIKNPGDAYLKKFLDLIRQKYRNWQPDVVFGIDDEATDILLEYGEELFPGVPHVFVTAERKTLQRDFLKPNMTSLSWGLDIKGTVDLIYEILPQTRQIFIITGSSVSDRAVDQLARQQLRGYTKGIEFIYLPETTLNDLLEKIARLPEHSVLIYPTFMMDSEGKSYVGQELVPDISEKANVPTFGIIGTFMGHGIVGGHLISAAAQGRRCAEIGLRILGGELPVDIVPTRVLNIKMFDQRQLRRWGINESDLPQGSIVLYKELSVWEQYRSYIIGFISLLLFMVVVILVLVFLRRKSKQIEGKLAKTEQMYRTVADFTYDWEYWISPDGTFRYVSPSCERITGYNSDQFVENPSLLREIMVPEDRNRWDSHRRKSQEDKGLREMSFRIKRSNGEVRWIEHACQPVFTIENEFLGIRASNRDITERRQAEESLSLHRQKLMRAEKIARMGFLDWNLKTNEIVWSSELYEIYGIEPGMPITLEQTVGMVHSDDSEFVVESLDKAIKGLRDYAITHRMVRPDGQVLWVQARAELEWDKDGVPAFLFGTVVDITALKQVEEDLKISENSLLKAQEVAHFGIWHFNMLEKNLVWTDECYKIFGIPKGTSITYEKLLEVVHSEDRDYFDRKWNAAQKGEPYDFEHRILIDNELKWVREKAELDFDDNGNPTGGVGIIQDITERKLADLKILESYSEISELKEQLEQETLYLREEINLEHNYKNIVGNSHALKYVLFKVEQISETDSGVLIQGETGTGKELIARAIHNNSKRKNRPLVKINCAALPDSLIESELFGHERGSFTGAHARKLGRFEVADGSSLFLDEISELPLELQAKMLRVIEDGEFERVGGSKTIKVDVRIIAATNRNLEEEVLEGRFRKDLWYRLNVFPITIPPLRERDEDISLLVQYYMDLFSRKHGKQISSITESSMKVMQGHAWPGNVRELANFLERSVISTSGSTLRLAGDLKQNHQSSTANHKNHKSLHDMERDYIVEVLEKTNWKVSGKNSAVEILKLDRSTLRNKMNKLGIRKPGSSI